VSQRTVGIGREAGSEGETACGCCAPAVAEGRAPIQGATVLTAPDISCGGCANAIRNALGALEGVSRVEVDVETKAVAVGHDPKVSREALVAALERAGFPAS
jgi:copper chaperone